MLDYSVMDIALVLEDKNMSEERFECVSESKEHKHRSYVMRRPRTRDNPTKAQKKARSLFAEAARKATDEKGTVLLEEGKEVPKTAEAVQKNMKGVKLAKPKVPRFVPPEVATMVQLKEAMAKLARKH